MSMNWTQYLLGKLAEEASEVTKEALKCQQHGVASQYKGRNAIMELRNEFLELMAVIDMLEERKDVQSALREFHINPVTGHDVCQDDDHYDITHRKMLRLCFYALIDYQAGTLSLTREEFDLVKRKADQHHRGDDRSADGIVFREPGIGSYYRDTIIDPPSDVALARSMGATLHMANTMADARNALAPVTVNLGGTLQECVHRMKNAIELNCQLVEAEWDPVNKEEAHKSQNTDGTQVYSWCDRKDGVRIHLHVQVEHYDIIKTDLRTGRHVSTERGEYKTF